MLWGSGVSKSITACDLVVVGDRGSLKIKYWRAEANLGFPTAKRIFQTNESEGRKL
jgi:hypothetical protein